MLRLILSVWLICSVVGYGTALAVDLHHGAAEASLAASSDLPADDGQHPDCDHCGHGTTHLLGLNSQGALVLLTLPNRHRETPYLVSWRAPLLPPDSRPPILGLLFVL